MPNRFASQSLMARQLKTVYKDTTTDRYKSPITDLIDQIIDPPAYSGGFESDDDRGGVEELIEAIRSDQATPAAGVEEASRTLRKKLKYGDSRMQIRSLAVLKGLSQRGPQVWRDRWADGLMMARLKEMARDPLLDPRVKHRLEKNLSMWAEMYSADPNGMKAIFLDASAKNKQPETKSARTSVEMPRRSMETTAVAPSRRSMDVVAAAPPPPPSSFGNDLEHSWAPTNNRGGGVPREYADLAAARASADARRAERDRQAALEARATEIERRERAVRMKEQAKRDAEEKRRAQADAEVRRMKAMQLEERERQLRKEERHKAKQELRARPKVPPFDYAREKPNMIVSIANANQAANNLVNALRHVNREREDVKENGQVILCLDRAKFARRPIVRYIQFVTDEEYVGVLLEANEKIVEAIQLYDKLSRTAGAEGTDDDDNELAGKMGQLNTSSSTAAPGELDFMQAEQRYRVERHNAHDDAYDDAGARSSDDEEFLSRFASVDESALDPFADDQLVDVSPRKARQECELRVSKGWFAR